MLGWQLLKASFKMKQRKNRKLQSIRSKALSAKKERIRRRSFGWTEIIFSDKSFCSLFKEVDKSTKRLDAPKVFLSSKTGPVR